MSFFSPRSFRVDIITAFTVLLLSTFAVVLAYNYANTSRIVLILSDDIMDRTTALVIQRTSAFLQHPADLTELTARLLNRRIISWQNFPQLEHYFIGALRVQPQVSIFYYGDRAGNFILARREDAGKVATKHMRRQGQKILTTWKIWGPDQKLLAQGSLTTDTFDHRLRPWYQGAAAARGLFWSDLYIFYTGHEPGLTVSYPVLDARGEVAGVVGCDLALLQLSHFLRELTIGKNGLAFILNEKNEVVAYPDPAQVVVHHDAGQEKFPVPITSLANPTVVAAFQQFVQSGQEEFPFQSGGRAFLASFTNFPASFGNRWRVGVIVPEEDFTAEVDHLTRRVMIICLAFLALALGLAVWLARLISKPVLQLAAETDQIRKLELATTVRLRSHITEIQVLTQAVERMKATLRSFLRFAPRQLVQEIILADTELLLGGERREVTLLFSDLRSFTQFAEQNRPEEVVQVLNRHFEAMVCIITQYQGYTVDFLGDSLFAAFGALHPDPEHAQHAVACAVAMQLTQQQLNAEAAEQHLPALEMGIGINSGTCVVGNMGSLERIKYDVVGHAVNVAARIETFTVGGQILISEATRQALNGGVVLAGPYQAFGKGVEGPLQVYEVRGLTAPFEVTVPPTVPDLRPVQPPLAIHLRLITGKQVATGLHPATLTRLGQTGAAFTTAAPLENFAPVQVGLPECSGGELFLDGKVVASNAAGQDYLVKFSPLSPAAAALIDRLLSGGQDSPAGSGP